MKNQVEIPKLFLRIIMKKIEYSRAVRTDVLTHVLIACN